jgi:hypothetical protein
MVLLYVYFLLAFLSFLLLGLSIYSNNIEIFVCLFVFVNSINIQYVSFDCTGAPVYVLFVLLFFYLYRYIPHASVVCSSL